MVWLDYLEKSEAPNNSSGFAQFWESVESINISASTTAAMDSDGMLRGRSPFLENTMKILEV